MSKTVFRYDRGGSLRSPVTTSQGFLRADGHAARVGIYKYRRADGSTQYELRPRDEVFHPDSLASYDAAPVTLGHPPEGDVTAENVKRHEVGTVAGAGRQDGDRVATSTVIKDAAAIKAVRAGKQELSPGYRIRLDETPGFAPEYATPDNPTGRYDAVQRDPRINHLAIVDRARGGSDIRLRLDEAEIADAPAGRTDSNVRLTTIADGHQHSIDLDGSYSPWGGGSPMAGCTSYATATGKEHGHTHDWIRNSDGTITIAMSEDHTHGILDGDSPQYGGNGAAPGQRADAVFDRSPTRPEHGSMATTQTGSAPPPDAAEQIRLLTVRADEADRTATEQRSRADALAADRDGLQAELTTVKERLKATEERLAAGTAAVETAAVTEQRRRADAAERELSQVKASIPALVRQRAGLVAKAQAVLGPTFRADGLTDREVLVHGIRHLMPKEPTGPEVSDDYLRRRFDALIEDRATYSASLSRASDALAMRTPVVNPTARTTAQRADELPWADQWKAGLGQFSTASSQKGG